MRDRLRDRLRDQLREQGDSLWTPSNQRRISLTFFIAALSFGRYDKGRKSGYNTAIGLFLENAVRGNYPNLEVNFSAMQISKGTLPALSKWEFSVNDNNISLTWLFEKNKNNAYGDDSVQVILFNLSKRSFTLLMDLAKRGDEKMDSSLPMKRVIM